VFGARTVRPVLAPTTWKCFVNFFGGKTRAEKSVRKIINQILR